MTTMVKKLKLWMMAAILTLCGASVLTACSSNEETAKTMGYDVIITADHGNADHAVGIDGMPNTAHSTNPVPFIYVTANKKATVSLSETGSTPLLIFGRNAGESLSLKYYDAEKGKLYTIPGAVKL